MSANTITLRTRWVGTLQQPACKSPVQLEIPSRSKLAKLLITGNQEVRKWWNWQTHHLEGVAPKGVGFQIPPSAPKSPRVVRYIRRVSSASITRFFASTQECSAER